MYSRAVEDVITQAELRKGAELMAGTSSAIRFIAELYICALKRRLANGAIIEPGPRIFDRTVGVVCGRKEPARETRIETAAAVPQRHLS